MAGVSAYNEKKEHRSLSCGWIYGFGGLHTHTGHAVLYDFLQLCLTDCLQSECRLYITFDQGKQGCHVMSGLSDLLSLSLSLALIIMRCNAMYSRRNNVILM